MSRISKVSRAEKSRRLYEHPWRAFEDLCGEGERLVLFSSAGNKLLSEEDLPLSLSLSMSRWLTIGRKPRFCMTVEISACDALTDDMKPVDRVCPRLWLAGSFLAGGGFLAFTLGGFGGARCGGGGHSISVSGSAGGRDIANMMLSTKSRLRYVRNVKSLVDENWE